MQELVKNNASTNNTATTVASTNNTATTLANTNNTVTTATTVATTSSGHALQNQQRIQISSAYNLIHEEEKWLLPSGNKLEDTLKHVCDERLHEDLCHSWVVDLGDCAFVRHLSQDDVDAILAAKVKQLPAVDRALAASIEALMNWHNANNSSAPENYSNMLQFVV